MDAADHLTQLRSESAALLAAVGDAWDAPVPTCPGWTAATLVGHLGVVHRWATLNVVRGERVRLRDMERAPTAPAELRAWLTAGAGAAAEAMAEAGPGAEVWTFSSVGDRRVAWWARRMAVETAVHRWDAQVAAGTPTTPVDARLAVDGVDEYLIDLLPAVLGGGAPGMTGTLHLHATDAGAGADGEWWLDLDDPGTARREHIKADTAVRGTGSDLLAWVWNRPAPGPGPEVLGATAVADAWATLTL